VREEVVKRLRAAIQSGAYRVDPEAIAERMLAEGLFEDLFRDR
jgi:anti-sigma28 factor (negative regulator of flagellin synthesis)